MILENGDVQTGSVRASQQFKDYLKEQGITETTEVESGLPLYRVGTDVSQREASRRLCDIAGDMLMVFDVDPTAIHPQGDSRMQFANQLGIFYIDRKVVDK
jgi:hypothetical protein